MTGFRGRDQQGSVKPSGPKKINRQLARTTAGVVLVVASVVAVGFITHDRSDTRVVVAAKNPLIIGQTVTGVDTVEIRVPATAAFDVYVSPAELADGIYAAQSLGVGEFIPRSILVAEKPHDDAVVTIELRVGNPAWLRQGAVAEMWVSPLGDNNSFRPPFVVSPEVVIVQVSREDGFAADQTTSLVDVLVPRRHLSSVLHALANNHVIHVTPVSG